MKTEPLLETLGFPLALLSLVVVIVGTELITMSSDIGLPPTPTLQIVLAEMLTLTPTPTHTRIPTSSPTPTPNRVSLPPIETPTPTDTSVPPTDNPTPTDTLAWPTDTPTPVPPPTAIPIPVDAVAAAINGVELLCGPGTKPNSTDKYDLITVVPQGTGLDVLRRVVGKEDWIKVGVERNSVDIANVSCPGSTSVFSESGDNVEGWVLLGAIEVNIELSNISSMYEFGPHLLNPEPFAQRSIEDIITFTWQDYGSLAENQIYSLMIVRDGLPDAESCYHWQTKTPEMMLKFKDFENCTRGDYHWSVGLATDLSGGIGDTRNWRDDSEFDERNPIGIDQPHSGAKSANNSIGGSGGGTIISDPKN